MSNVQTAVWALRLPCCLRVFVNGYYQMPIRKKKKRAVGTTDQTPQDIEVAGTFNSISKIKMKS